MNSFAEYIRELRKNLEKGDSTEHTQRTALEALLEACDKGIDDTNEPRAGSPAARRISTSPGREFR